MLCCRAKRPDAHRHRHDIFESGLTSGGKPGLVLDLAAADKYKLGLSEEIIAELVRILSGKKFRWREDRIHFFVDRIRLIVDMVDPKIALTDCMDADDNRIPKAALAGSADYIVTGVKRHLLSMKGFRGIPILSPNDFLVHLELLDSRQ